VLNGKRDSDANATEKSRNRGIKTFQPRITRTTQRGMDKVTRVRRVTKLKS